MQRADLLTFIRSHRYAVQASVAADGSPQAALVGIAVSDAFEIVFDTLETSRKAVNLEANGRIAFVIGGTADGDERTVQYEGIAVRATESDRDALLSLYFSVFPDGRQRLAWRGITHFRVTPTWIRYSNYNANPPEIVELAAANLAGLQ
jgi:pyridoxine/pyridoxamine 5'-phosphate oxidase